MIIIFIHTKVFVEFCIGLGAMNFLISFFRRFPKMLTFNIEMARYINSNFPNIFSEGAYDHHIHTY